MAKSTKKAASKKSPKKAVVAKAPRKTQVKASAPSIQTLGVTNGSMKDIIRDAFLKRPG